MGVFFTCYYVGLALLPALAGALRDATRGPNAPILFSTAMMICSLIFLVAFRVLEHRRKALASQEVV
jgi:hypothetical protein